MKLPVKSSAGGLLASRLFSGMRFPKLFAVILGLFILDVLLPDVVPFIDELILGALAVLIGLLRDDRTRTSKGKPDIPD